MNVFEPGVLTIAAVVDHEVAALEPDLRQFAAVEAKCAEAVYPGKESREAVLDAAARLDRALLVVGCGRPDLRVWLTRCQRRRSRERALIGPGRNRDSAVGFDPDRKLCADKIEALSARVATQQTRAGKTYLSLGSAGHDSAVMITHRNGEDAHRGAAVLVAFQYGAADLDAKPVAEIFCDRSSKPRRDNVERYRPARQHQPKPASHQHGNRRDRGRAD